ncbi:MAG: anion transporter [Clostridium butyricum]|nr:anion transporter [Clostridium butyricum]
METGVQEHLLKREKIREYLKKECVMVTALLLAIITSFISIPKLEYIDFKVIILLFNLMIIVAAFKKLKILDYIAAYLVQKCTTVRGITYVLVFVTFIGAMVVTNDVALITFVPITLIVGRKLNIDIMKLVILQTIGANLGSALTPMGNPQNLFIYSFYNLSPYEFLKITLPLVIVSSILLIIVIYKMKSTDIKIIDLNRNSIEGKIKAILYTIILLIILASVFKVLDYRIAFIVTLIGVMFLDRSLFKRVDYSLLLTFAGFFIFIGNISNMTYVKNILEALLSSPQTTYFSGLIASQFISNVPSTMLLSGFTNHYEELLLGVNVGGLGTLIASLASIISYKLYVNENFERSKEYIKCFSIYNFIGLIILSFIFECIKIL